ncbi:hypothetical protein [Secundilactobacillus odoratitofui]|nr:hypothetical protein [Secundilactobacillus odoratitofui]
MSVTIAPSPVQTMLKSDKQHTIKIPPVTLQEDPNKRRFLGN